MKMLALLLLFSVTVHATGINVQHDGVTQFCATGGPYGLDGVNNYTGTCTTPPGVCVPDATRTRFGSMVVGYSVQNTQPTTRDALTFEPIFGRAANSDPPPLKNFPGVSGTGPVLNWSLAHHYYSAKFHTPATGRIPDISLAFESNDSRGCFNTNGSPGPCGQPFYDVSISRVCNDYGPTSKAVLHTYSDGQPHFRATMGYPQDPQTLARDTDYYLNIRLSDPADYWRTSFITWRGSVTP